MPNTDQDQWDDTLDNDLNSTTSFVLTFTFQSNNNFKKTLAVNKSRRYSGTAQGVAKGTRME